MRNKNYYSLVAGLPDLTPDDKKIELSSVRLRDYLQEELDSSDYKWVQLFFLPGDHENLLNLLFENQFQWNELGNFPRELLERFVDKKQTELTDTSDFPPYFIEIIENYHQDEEAYSKASANRFLTEKWHELLNHTGNDFIAEFGTYKKNRSNIMLALNGRKHNIPFDEALIGDDDITYALKRSRTRDFGLANEVGDIEQMVQIFEIENLLERELRLDNLTWQFIDESTFFNYFTIEKILGFLLKLFIVERWHQLDSDKGQLAFKQLLEALQTHFEFPEEFAITYGKRK